MFEVIVVELPVELPTLEKLLPSQERDHLLHQELNALEVALRDGFFVQMKELLFELLLLEVEEELVFDFYRLLQIDAQNWAVDQKVRLAEWFVHPNFID